MPGLKRTNSTSGNVSLQEMFFFLISRQFWVESESCTVEDHPLGYPRVSRFLDSDDSFMIYRRFGTLQARILLRKQDELRKLEDQLNNMDKYDDETEYGRQCLSSRAKDAAMKPEVEGGETRDQLLDRIEKKHLEYGKPPESPRFDNCNSCTSSVDTKTNTAVLSPISILTPPLLGQLLLQAQSLASMNRPPARDQRSVLSFLTTPWEDAEGNERPPLARADSKYIYEREDLVSLKTGRENAWLDATVERMLKYLHCRPVEWMFCSEVSCALPSTSPRPPPPKKKPSSFYSPRIAKPHNPMSES